MPGCLRKHYRQSIGLIGLALVASSAGFGQNAVVSYLPGIDFSKYHTYRWVTTHPHPIQNVDAQIQQSIDKELAARGLTKNDSMADLTVDYRVAISTREEWSQFRYNEIDTLTPTKVTVYTGTLGVDFSDSKLNQLVWSGTIAKAVDPNAAAGAKQKNLNKSVQALLKTFPPKRPSN